MDWAPTESQWKVIWITVVVVLAAWWWGAEGDWRRVVETDAAVLRTKEDWNRLWQLQNEARVRGQRVSEEGLDAAMRLQLQAQNDVRWSAYEPRVIVTALMIGAFVIWRLEKRPF
jgi:hypothetical protein